MRPWPWHRGVRLNAGDQRNRFVGRERDVNLAERLCHLLRYWFGFLGGLLFPGAHSG